MGLLSDFGKPGTNEHLDNRMNENFVRRLALSGILSMVVFLVLLVILAIPIIMLFGHVIAMVLTLMLYCFIIAVVADALHLIPFPAIEILRNQHDSARRKECRAQVKHGIYALPMSFLAVIVWSSLLSRVLDNLIPILLMLCLVPPLTIMTVIVVADCKSPEWSLVRSIAAFLIVALSGGIIISEW